MRPVELCRKHAFRKPGISRLYPRGCIPETALKPLDRDDFAAGRADPLDGFPHRLGSDHHMEGVGVEQCGGVAHDRHVPVPEHEIAASQRGNTIITSVIGYVTLISTTIAAATGQIKGGRL